MLEGIVVLMFFAAVLVVFVKIASLGLAGCWSLVEAARKSVRVNGLLFRPAGHPCQGMSWAEARRHAKRVLAREEPVFTQWKQWYMQTAGEAWPEFPVEAAGERRFRTVMRAEERARLAREGFSDDAL